MSYRHQRPRKARGPLHLFALLFLVGALAPELAQAETDLAIGSQAVIAYADGKRVRLRAEPDSTAEVRALLAEGSTVLVEGDPESGDDGIAWAQVVTRDGSTGYVSADYLATGSMPDAPAPETLVATTTDTVHLRAGPSLADAILDTLETGTSVSISGESLDGWLAVSIGQAMGFIHGDYLTQGTPAIDAKAGPGTRYTLDRVRLRTGPSTSYRTITVLPVGVRLDFGGTVDGSYAKVSSSYGTGWVSAQYIGPGAPSGGGSGSAAYTNDAVSQRTGPSRDYGRTATLATGTKLTLTGATQNGYSKVTSWAGTGWVATSYISSVAPQYTGGTRYTIDSVNLRRSPGLGGSVIAVVPSRTTITFTGTVVNNFGKVATRFGDGWISIDYFRKTRPSTGSGSSSSLVAWPVKGGSWYVSQGYNGSSHQNETRYWQYYYSFDIKKSSGSTAWQPVYAPVDGRVRWIDESTGGLSIYMGDGLAFAMFHMYLDASIREGGTVRQGQYLGVIAPSGAKNNGGSPHLHITAWTTADEGNWSRHAQPFTGRFSIEGSSFPSRGRSNDYRGYEFNP